MLAAPAVLDALLRSRPPGRPVVVAVDGRGGAGKSTVAAMLAACATDAGERAAVVATDDVAWAAQAYFDWDALLAERVLTPARRGEAVCLRPSTRPASGFVPGVIEVPADTTVLLVEGVGASRRALAPLLDQAVWVQSDLDVAFERGVARDRALWKRTREAAETQWNAFLTEEIPHLATDRPWERANLVLAGNTAESAPDRGDLRVAVQSQALDKSSDQHR